MSKQMTFGQWVKERRRRLDLTREGLALCAVCSLATIEKVETGERRASRQIAELLAGCLKVPAADVSLFVSFARGELQAVPPFLMALVGQATKEVSALNLPSPPTAFIGREREVELVRTHLRRDDVRLLTLMGPPGIGKTRLSIQAASGMASDFRDGVYFIALSTATTENLVTSIVAQALGVRENSSRSLQDAIKRKVRDLRLLLVLDNFEQVIPAGKLVAEWLSAAPGLKALATSRTVLHVYGEHPFSVPPMSLPGGESGVLSVGAVTIRASNNPALALTGYEAIDLFVQRARAAHPDFSLTEENAQAVTQICRRLDGLPLAIELAAQRVKVLSPQMILARLGKRLDLLVDGPVDLPDRQRTLRGAIDWSYSLLDPEEQALFRRLSVFSGGCALEAISALEPVNSKERAQHPEIRNSESDIINILSSLVDKSLLRCDAVTREPWFSMLETVREYAWEKINLDRDEYRETVERHTAYYIQLAERAEPELSGAQQASWLDILEHEHDNFRVVLQRSLDRGDIAALSTLAATLRRFWYLHAHISEGREWFQHALSEGRDLPIHLRARVLHGAGTLAWAQGDNASAGQFFAVSLAIWRELGDKHGIANMLNNLGIVALPQGDYSSAHAMHTESLALYRELDEPWSVALALANLGLVALNRGEYREAQALLADSLRLRRSLGDKQGVAQSLNNLGIVMRCLGEKGQAHSFHTESLAMFRALGDRWSIALTLANLGLLALYDDPLQARILFNSSLELFIELDARQGIATCLDGLAELNVATGRVNRAAILFGAVEELRSVLRLPLPRDRHESYNMSRTKAQAHLGADRFTELWRDGQLMSLETSCVFALEREQE